MKKTIQILAALLLLLALATAALADGTVTYLNRTDLFDFKPGSTYHVTDLFDSFKGVLPGDVITQTVTVRNSSNSNVRIWLQATPETSVETDARDFLDQLQLTVTSSDKTIFNAQASESAQLTEAVLLGFFTRGGKVDLTVTLKVPQTLGNAYMGQVGVVPWTFIVEEIPDEVTPSTGDWYESAAWIALAGALLLAILAVLLLMRRRRAQN